MVEIYNETIVDLLVDDVKTLEIRTLGNRIVIPGLSDMFVENVADIKAIMALGDKHRSVASTKMNSTRLNTELYNRSLVHCVLLKVIVVRNDLLG